MFSGCGTVQEGQCALHRCDNPACVNPTHLFIGTKKDNAQDCVEKGRHRGPAGVRHRCAKLTPERVTMIRLVYERYSKRWRITQTKLASLFGVDSSTVSRVISREQWRQVA